MRHIGILAHSAEGAALCFLTCVHAASAELGAHDHPDITMSIEPMARALPDWEANDLPPIRALLARTAGRLEAAGADFWVCPDNTAHIALETEGEPFPIPGLHIAEVVAQAAKAHGFRSVGLLGTKWTMEGPAYRHALARHGLERRIPDSQARADVNRIIFDELCNGVFSEESRARYVAIIEDLKTRGCDCVALSCTEIPLLVTPEVSPLPTLDSTRLLAQAAVRVALEQEPLPTWRGGAV
jgi:aspartate racemase